MARFNVDIALCQMNLTTGDFSGNLAKMKGCLEQAKADIYVFQECFVSNYAADDMLLDAAFLAAAKDAVLLVGDLSYEHGTTIVFGAPYQFGSEGRRSTNALFIAHKGQIVRQHTKFRRPNYDVFDDVRYFVKGEGPETNEHRWQWSDGERSLHIGTAICEDIWEDDDRIVRQTRDWGDDLIIAINSSPFAIGKAKRRRQVVIERMHQAGAPIIYVNQVGGNDELIFDGGSCVACPAGGFYEMDQWKEGVDVVTFRVDIANDDTISLPNDPIYRDCQLLTIKPAATSPELPEKYVAACMGLRDYYTKVGIWDSVVLGLSGGADSALVAMMAADVLGPEKVRAVMMPSEFTSQVSNTLAQRLASGVGTGIQTFFLPVAHLFDAYQLVLSDGFGPCDFGLADENLQAHIRGNLLSYYSNRFGAMLMSTGNKSELALGYATLYGDMRGAYNPVGDLYKTEVWDLIQMRVEHARRPSQAFADLFQTAFQRELQPMTEDSINALEETGKRPPSAELRSNQLDTDSLPPYPVLDAVLKAMIDNKESWTDERIATETKHPLALVQRVRRQLRRAEYKRNQATPKAKIHMKSFARKDWRYPLVNKFVQ